MTDAALIPDRPEIVVHTQRLLNSFKRWTGRELMERRGAVEEQSRALFNAPFVVVSDGTQADPVLNYGNAAALKLWVMTWEQLTSIPSRQTAEPVHQSERARLMAEVTANGFIANYKGIRIASTGARFSIDNAIVWIVTDESQKIIGKAATFATWTPVN